MKLYHGSNNDYDIVEGLVANDRTMPVISLFFTGVYTEEETIRRLLPQKLQDQIVFKTEKSLQSLKFRGVNKKMTKEMEFFIFLIEQYAFYKKITADKVLEKLEQLNLTQFVYDMYEIYHTEDLHNAFDDIDKLILERGKSNGSL